MAVGDVTPKLLSSPTFISGSSIAFFTVPTSHQYAIKQIVVCNTDGVERWIKLAKGVAGVAFTVENCFVYQLPIAAYDTVVLDTALVLEAGETLEGAADTPYKVTVTITGWDRQTA